MKRGLFLLVALFIAACATPYGIYHKVREKEDLDQISLMYQVDVDKLRSANNMGANDEVSIGQYLFVPGVKAPLTEIPPEVKAAHLQKKKEKSKEVTSANVFQKTHGKQKTVGETAATSGSAQFGWPLKGVLSSPFGVRDGTMHEGIDISVPEGTPVAAAGDGKVIFAADHGGYGLVVIIQHKDNYFTVYAHNSKLLVQEGQSVKRGEQIALSGNTGRTSGPHLHFEVRIGSKPQDPIPFLSRAPVAQ